MSLRFRTPPRLALPLAIFCCFCSLATPAATSTNTPASIRTNGAAHIPLSILTLASPTKSPVTLFRELLAMTPLERSRSLTNRSPETRRQILQKVREYESLRANDRELRLKVTELGWYMSHLMNLGPATRAGMLERIPAEDRSLLEGRLREWDKLPPELQKQFRDNEATLEYFYQLAAARTNILNTLSPQRRAMLQKGITTWNGFSAEEQQKMLARFNQFFELTADEKQKVLRTVSEAERKQMEKTLQKFQNLPPEKREQCLQSFAKFASLSLEDRQQFLKNAERWKRMTPDEREAWREVVRKVSPPRPPLPPGLPRRAAPASETASQAMATNRN